VVPVRLPYDPLPSLLFHQVYDANLLVDVQFFLEVGLESCVRLFFGYEGKLKMIYIHTFAIMQNCARGGGFDPRTVQTFVSMNMSVSKWFSSSYPYPAKWGRYNMFSSCCDKDSAIIFTTGGLTCLTSILLETGVDANNCKCNRDQRLNVLRLLKTRCQGFSETCLENNDLQCPGP
jgi:hypothetical protein